MLRNVKAFIIGSLALYDGYRSTILPTTPPDAVTAIA